MELINFEDTNDSIDSYPDGKKGWTDNLDDQIKNLLNFPYGTYTFKINLVCHSAGGLAAREYASNSKYAGACVNKLVLIGTPNLGAPIASRLNAFRSTFQFGSLFNLRLYLALFTFRKFSDFIARDLFISNPDISEAAADMCPNSNFLCILNSRMQPSDVKYYAIYGTIGSLFNRFFFGDYNGGDGIVSNASQLGENIISFSSPPINIKAFHTQEPDISVSGDNPLLKLLDSDRPEIEVDSPASGTRTTELTLRIKGRVFHEYLPADSKLIITAYRNEDQLRLPDIESFLKPTDLWIPSNPDSPVAEFDEPLNLPGPGTYVINMKALNPAGLLSEIKHLIIIVEPQVQSGYLIVHVHNPEQKEIASINGMSSSDVTIYDNGELLGHGADTAQAHNQPFALEPGYHTIRVDFNGMSIIRWATITTGKTSELHFVFDRTEYPLYNLLRNAFVVGGSCSGHYLFTDGSPEYHQDDYSTDKMHFTSQVSAYYVNGRVIRSIYMHYDVSSYSTNGYLIAEITGHKDGVQDFGLDAKVELYPKNGAFTQAGLFPARQDFQTWFMQSSNSGDYPSFSLRRTGSTDDYPLIPWEPGYFFSRIPANLSFDTIAASQFMIWLQISTRQVCPYTERVDVPSVTGTLDFLKMSNVPYDYLGNGI